MQLGAHATVKAIVKNIALEIGSHVLRDSTARRVAPRAPAGCVLVATIAATRQVRQPHVRRLSIKISLGSLRVRLVTWVPSVLASRLQAPAYILIGQMVVLFCVHLVVTVTHLV